MAKQTASVLLFFSVLAFFCSGLLAQYDQEFDYFQLILDWPISFCSAHDCYTNNPHSNFTIHGFFPKIFYGGYLTDCYYVPYTPITWQELLDGLNRNWPNLIFPGNDQNWRHQWYKHGTCSLIFYYQMMYFDLAVELHEGFDFLVQLEGRGIVPTNSFLYSIQAIKDAVKNLTTKDPDINCRISRQGNLVFTEIRICFTPGGEIMDCFPRRLAKGCTSPFAYFPETIM